MYSGWQLTLNSSRTYDVSIIIVNYNVEYFLDQCIASIYKSNGNLSIELIVVDNNSRDGSIEMLATNYPEVHVIANKENLGFSRANNQGIAESNGKYILLLNPDTVIGEDTLTSCYRHMETFTEYGALGIRMINGKGEYLPESKRGLPTPWVAFYKLSGLSKFFPRSKRFNRYHAGHIKETETADIEILSGAFMFLRKETLIKTGNLDETFFMYGEDIDLSYRILLAGYHNCYFGENQIIHYKGESTKKSSINYVFVFYRAMVIFAKKHFGRKNAGSFSFIINVGIYLRATAAILARIVKSAVLPIVDLTYLTVGLFALTNYWSKANIEFPQHLIYFAIPLYAIVWYFSILLNGAYDFPLRITKVIKGSSMGTAVLLIIYALLPKELQFSRLFIFTGMAWLLIYYIISRSFLQVAVGKRYKLFGSRAIRVAVVSESTEFDRIRTIIERSNSGISEVVRFDSIPALRASKLTSFQEIIFSTKELDYKSVIQQMIDLRNLGKEFKISPSGRNYLIGSNSIDTSGDLYILDINNLVSTENLRKKRVFDMAFGMLGLLLFPFIFFVFRSAKHYFKNMVQILLGKKSFIGFSEDAQLKDVRLPRIKRGILTPCDGIAHCDEDLCEKLNLLYARDYSLRKDLRLVLKAWKKLDRN